MADRPPARVIAIDGPAASGKSTVARRVAAELGYAYVDSGSLYRAVTLQAVRKNVAVGDADGVVGALAEMEMSFSESDGAVAFECDGVDPGLALRSEDVRERVSEVAAIPGVREQVVAWLREMTAYGDLVMEGRDIGSVVFPDAVFKFYLDARLEERARRRHAELAERDEQSEVEDVMTSLQNRDARDSSRAVAPLVIAPGATVIDSSAMGIDDVVASVLAGIRTN